MENVQAVSLNGNSAQVMNSLFEKAVPGFDSILGNVQGLDMSNLNPSSLANMLEKFNTTVDSLSLVKNVFQGKVPEVFSNLSSLAETFFEKTSAAAAQSQEMDQTMDQAPDMAPAPTA